MTNTFITTNTINVGAGFTFAASGDALVVLPGVTLGSTTGVAVANGGFTDLEVTILGTLTGPGMLVMPVDSGFTIGLGGTMVSQQAVSGNAALFLVGGNSQATIDGTLLAAETIAILANTGNNTINVSGSVTGGSGGVWLGLGGGSGDALVNSGTIRCGTYADLANPIPYNNAVLTQGPNTRITNLAGGNIVATSSEGAGVRLGSGATGTVVWNAGTISASFWYGVDFTLLGVAETGTLYNSGVIQGLAGAFNGNDTIDTVTNRGTMIGDVLLGDGSDVLDGRGGSFEGQVFGGTGDDRMDFRGTGLLAGTVFGGAGSDTILGTEGDDTISGEGDGDTLRGGGGDDELLGGDGDDIVRGGAGDDTIAGGSGSSTLYGGLGDDTIFIDVNSEGPFSDLTAHGGAGNDAILGGLQADNINGGDGDDTLQGGSAADLLSGNAGADLLDGGTENDILNGGAGDDTLLGGDQRDVLSGDTGDDSLDGGADRDTLFGGTGSDTLTGGLSFDEMTGGLGSDLFVFAATAHIGITPAARDKINDFVTGQDLIDLMAIDANIFAAGNQSFTFIGTAAFTSVAGQLRYSPVNGLLQGDADGDGVTDFSLELVSRPIITVADIVL